MTREREPEVAGPPVSERVQEPAQQPLWMRREARGVTAGVILLTFGVLMLIANITQWWLVGLLVLPILGLMFLVAGVMTGRPSLMVPGGILTGLGWGALLSQTIFVGTLAEAQGGIVVFGLAVGFLMITPLCYIVGRSATWWPAIPGGILVVVGLALIIGGQAMVVLDIMGVLWPVILIVIGALLLLRHTMPERNQRDDYWRARR
jgi:hypothetical protein